VSAVFRLANGGGSVFLVALLGRSRGETESHVTERDQFIQSQVGPQLMPGEQVLHTAFMARQPGLLWQLLLVGGLLLFLMTKAYYAVLTDRRLILLRTKQGFFSPQMVNMGIEQYEVAQMTKCTVSGIANNRSMTFHFRDGTKETLRISPWLKLVSGTKAFFEQVPQLINSGQLAAGAQSAGALGQGQQGGYGAPPQQQQMGGYGAPQQQQQPQMGAYGAPQQQQQPHDQMGAYGAPPAQPASAPAPSPGFNPGSRVTLLWGDGNRYPATVVQVHGNQVLCAMDNGQQQWVEAQYLAPG